MRHDQASTKGRISLLSVVREIGRDRYMAVDCIVGEIVECVWIEAGIRQTGRFPAELLEVIPTVGSDDQRWRDAFRAGTNTRIG